MYNGIPKTSGKQLGKTEKAISIFHEPMWTTVRLLSEILLQVKVLYQPKADKIIRSTSIR